MIEKETREYKDWHKGSTDPMSGSPDNLCVGTLGAINVVADYTVIWIHLHTGADIPAKCDIDRLSGSDILQ